jgi:aminomethyltransferase
MVSPALADYFAKRKIPLLELSQNLFLPAEFSSFEQEYWAVRRAVGLFDFSFMSTVELIGSDAIAFLKLMQNRNCEELAIGKIAYSMLLNENGDVWLDATVWRLGPDHFYLITGYSILPFLLKAARPYRDLHLADIAGQYQVIAVQGPHSGVLLEAILGLKANDLPQYFSFNQPPNYPALTIARLGYTGELGYELLVPRAEAIALWQQLQTAAVFPALECGFLAANTLRIEAGFILFCNELIEPRTLASLGKLDSAKKEGNSGGLQEILVGLHFLPGTKVEDNATNLAPQLATKLAHEIAPHIQVTSRAFSPQLGHEIGLGFIDQAALINGEAGDQTRALVGNPLNSPLGPVYLEKLPFFLPTARISNKPFS